MYYQVTQQVAWSLEALTEPIKTASHVQRAYRKCHHHHHHHHPTYNNNLHHLGRSLSCYFATLHITTKLA